MSFNDASALYTDPCIVDKTSDYDWPSVLDFGEYDYPPSDSPEYPSLTLMYNGQVLNVHSEFVHASLSGISIKHYYGKCYEEITEEEETESRFPYLQQAEEGMDNYLWFHQSTADDESVSVKNGYSKKSSSATESGSFEYRQEPMMQEGQPICTLPRINSRNSFWNLHRPELCKLTWGQKYVSAATVTEHLHEHLTSHGQLCIGFHTEEERNIMLNRELDEYVRLKVLFCPKELPPDEPLFEFQGKPHYNPKCKVQKKLSLTDNNRYYYIKNDEEISGKEVRRSKEEFCLTIGKYIKEPKLVPSEHLLEESYITPELSMAAAEEEDFYPFYYNWFLYGEETLEQRSMTPSTSILRTSSSSEEEICPPLMLDDFCRIAGKADFSDLRCDTDL